MLPDAELDTEQVAALAHDMRASLTTVLLETDLLRGEVPQGAPRQALDVIERNVDFMDRMVGDLLDFATFLEVGRLELHAEEIALAPLLADVVARTVSTRQRDRVTLAIEAEVTVTVDRRIERVVANLLYNALKYAPRGSPIVVRLEARGRAARISVHDAGSTLTASDAARLFQKYHRAPTADGVRGTGLGLYISRKIVEGHRGRIDVDTSVGTTFFVELPA